MEQPVEERRSQCTVVIEDLRPVLIGAVGGDDQGTALIPSADDLEEQIGAMLIDG